MKEKPILFSAPMVRAILDGRKTRTKLYTPRGSDPCDPEHLAKRLLNGIERINDHGCWLWGRATSSGYGTITIAKRTVRVHRLIFALANGLREDALQEVCHNCPGGDNPLCLNPTHLFHGTHGDNVRDAIAKGSAAPPVGPILRGSLNPASKLTEQQVVEIRAAVAGGERQRIVALRYGITQSGVSAITTGKVRCHA